MARTMLITGSAGFIGYHVAQSLLERGYRVVGLDNFSNYYSPKLKVDRVARLNQSLNFINYPIDVCDSNAVLDVFRREQPDVVFHFAAQPGVRYSVTHPDICQKTNTEGFLSVLEASRKMRYLPRIVFTSSSSVYGANVNPVFSENDPTDLSLSLYAATKKYGEMMAYAYSRIYGLRIIILRPFTVYGPWGRPDMALSIFADAILHGRPCQVYGYGMMSRDFTYVEDLVKVVVLMAEVEKFPQYEIYNVGTGRSEGIVDVIKILSDSLGVKAEMEFLPMQAGDIHTTCADVQKLNEFIKYKPCSTVQEGIPAFVKWFKEYKP